MSRVKDVRKYVNHRLMKLDRETMIKASDHLNGVAMAAVLLAKKRGMDPECAAIAGLLHDLYAYESGSYEDHAHKGAELARTILAELKVTSDEETEQICSAVYHHDDKLVTDHPFDEVLKDADVMHHTLHDPQKEIKDKEKGRYEKLMKDFGAEGE
jgi:HD superfamily phosphodiesterase